MDLNLSFIWSKCFCRSI